MFFCRRNELAERAHGGKSVQAGGIGFGMSWKLKRVRQCAKCPWKVSTNPHDIPDGYSEALHRSLASTIAEPGSLEGTGRAMACHEHRLGEEAHWRHDTKVENLSDF
ncbi:hypothetical protein [Shinella granuli]|nr:hypothetical protein [Shinella granuli]